jgi:uncharacterized linocin/CFP29 family protein
MEEHVRFGGNGADTIHVLQHARLIVGVNDADELGVGLDRAAHVVGVEQAEAIDGQVCDLAANFFEALAGVEDGVVFDGRSDDVIAGLDDAKKRKIIAFRTPAGEDDFCSAAVQQLRHLLASVFHSGSRLLALLVNRRRIAELFNEVRPHGVEDFRQQRAGSVVVEVYAMHR